MNALFFVELNEFKEGNMKPNYSELGRKHDMDRKTVKKYAENPGIQRKVRAYKSQLDAFDSLIREKTEIAGITYRAIYSYLKNEKGLDNVTYGALTYYCRKKGYKIKVTECRPHVRYETEPGKQVQVDWKESIKLRTRNGEVMEFNVFTATLGFSRKHYFIYSPGKTEQDFLRCANELLTRCKCQVENVCL